MLPGACLPLSKSLRARRVEPGLYVVEGAYEGEYEYFAPSPLFPSLDSDPGPSAASNEGFSSAQHNEVLPGPTEDEAVS